MNGVGETPADRARVSRAAQGLPVTVEDPRALDRIATITRAAFADLVGDGDCLTSARPGGGEARSAAQPGPSSPTITAAEPTAS